MSWGRKHVVPGMGVKSHATNVRLNRYVHELNADDADGAQDTDLIYDIERAVFCAELSLNVYLGQTFWRGRLLRRINLILLSTFCDRMSWVL